jgi:hypothetical protein
MLKGGTYPLQHLIEMECGVAQMRTGISEGGIVSSIPVQRRYITLD